MASDDEEIIKVKAKTKAKPRPKSASGGPYQVRRSQSGKHKTKRSARELWLDTVKSGSGAMSSGRKPGQHPGKRTPTEYWMDTLRKTGQGRSTESTTMNTFPGTRPSDGAMPFLSTSHYLRQMTGAEKTPRKSQDPTSKPPPGTPNYKSQEEYYEEVLALRKQIAALSNDNSMVKSKLRRVEEDNSKKEKEIEKLLDPSKSEEMRRTLTDRRSADSGPVIHGLKQRIVRLEQQLKEKEAEYKKLHSDVKATRIEEMKIQTEALYAEVLRLKESGASRRKSSTTPAKESKESAAKVRALNETVLRLNQTNTRLQEENLQLKEHLRKNLEETQNNVDMVDGAEKHYSELTKRQLLSVIAKQEKKIEKLDSDNLSIMSDLDEKRKNGQVKGKIILTGSMSEKIDQLCKRETELLEEREKHLDIMKKLKEDKSYYREKCDTLEKQVKELRKELGKSTPGSDVLGLDVGSRADVVSRKSRPRDSVASGTSPRIGLDEVDHDTKVETFLRNRAAKVIQRSVKKHQKSREEDDDATLLQSALRGHQNRRDRANQLRKQLERPDSGSRGDVDSVLTDDLSLDDDVVTIQSAFRGHLGRKERKKHAVFPERKRPSSAKPSRLDHGLDSEGESLEDDSILSRAISPVSRTSKRPSSGRGVFSSPRRRSPALVENDEDDDDIVF